MASRAQIVTWFALSMLPDVTISPQSQREAHWKY